MRAAAHPRTGWDVGAVSWPHPSARRPTPWPRCPVAMVGGENPSPLYHWRMKQRSDTGLALPKRAARADISRPRSSRRARERRAPRPGGFTVPGTYPLSLYRGDSYAWQFKLWADAAKTTPIDLTGSTAKAEIRYETGGTDILAMTCTITTPNIIDVAVPAAKWATWPFKASSTPSWDLQVTTSSGAVTTYVAGPVVVVGDITDSVKGA